MEPQGQKCWVANLGSDILSSQIVCEASDVRSNFDVISGYDLTWILTVRSVEKLCIQLKQVKLLHERIYRLRVRDGVHLVPGLARCDKHTC